ncbi:uncharacterized protein LOC135137259 isoform X2 [Zophobas morio]|uniref:uncharacterized protein LOC135137259 isoform X2 n=1 Tax=Zophobas morio TaxID=2755281 RepID=UPI003083A99B
MFRVPPWVSTFSNLLRSTRNVLVSDHHESYASVRKRSTRVAIEMQKRGITFEDVVVTCSSSTIDTAIPIIATFYLGAKIANLDITLSVRQVTHLLSLVSPKMIFVEESAIGLIEKGLENASLETEIVVFGESSKYSTFSDFVKFQETEDQFEPVVVDLEEIAVILFSSGTTGLPKAVCHSNRSVLNFTFFFCNSSDHLDVILSFSSFYWITGVLFLTSTFIGGGHRVVCGNKVEAERTFKVIEKYKVTYMFIAPILSYQLTNFENYQSYNTSSLRVIMAAGTPLSTTQFNKLNTIFPAVDIIVCYGQSEVGMVSLFDTKFDKKFIRTKNKSAGKVVTGITLKIVDPETNQIMGPYQNGEIRLQSSGVMKGYYKTDSTEVFDDEGFLKTGDVAYFDEDGCIFYVERLKEMFKYLSWHIVPTAIESVLLEHPGVKEAVVFGFPRNEEEGEVPAACIVVNEGSNVSENEIEDFVSSRVSDREKLRGGVYFVEGILKTPTGKVKRKEVRKAMLEWLTK